VLLVFLRYLLVILVDKEIRGLLVFLRYLLVILADKEIRGYWCS
jgi:hypothetical protein